MQKIILISLALLLIVLPIAGSATASRNLLEADSLLEAELPTLPSEALKYGNVETAVEMDMPFALPKPSDINVSLGEEEKITLVLYRGWNMVSLPVAPENNHVKDIFGTNKVIVYRWDPVKKRYRRTHTMEPGESYWVYTRKAMKVDVKGRAVLLYSRNVYRFTNLIGTSIETTKVSDIKFDPESSNPPRYAYTWDAKRRRMVRSKLLEPGKGYMLLVLKPAIISVGDYNPPEITNVQVTPETDSALIEWETNEPSTSKVEYGTTSGYGNTVEDGSMVTSHSLILPSLEEDTLYHFKVSSTDAAGNTGESEDDNFTTLVGPPESPELIAPEDESIITDTTPEFNWTDPTKFDTPISYGLQVDNDLDFSSPEIDEVDINTSNYTTPLEQELALDSYHWRVRAFDGSEYSAWSEVWQFTIISGNQPPQVVINYPLNDSYHASFSYFNLTATDDNSTTLTCNYSMDSGSWEQAVVDNGVETSIPVNISGEGQHYIDTLCFDGDLWSNTTSIQFYLDLTAPTVQVLAPENNSYTNNATMEYNGSDNYGIDHYEVSLDGGNWTDNGMATTYTFNLTEGNHTLCVKAVDYVGLEGTACVDMMYDTTPPDAIIYSPLNETTIYSTSVEVYYNSSFDDIDYSEYKLDNGTWQADLDGSPTTFYNLSDGPHELYVRNVDFVGNIGPEDVVLVYIISQNFPPTVTILYPENEEYYLEVTEFTFKAIDDTASTLLCNYSIDEGEWQQINVSNNSEITIPITITEEGWHDLDITCSDGLNWSDIAHAEFYIDTTGPSVDITSPANDSYVQTATFTYEGDDGYGVGVDYYLVKVDSGAWIQTDNTTYNFDNLSDGQHWLYVKVVDELGNEGPEAKVNITLDTQLPYVYIGTPQNGDVRTGSWATMVYIASDESGVDHTEVRVDDGSWIVNSDNSSPYVYTFYGLSDGNRTLWAKAVDKAGNYNITSVWIIVNSHGPNVTITSPANGSYYEIDNVNVSFYANDSDIDTFQYSFNGADWYDTGIDGQPNVTYTYEVQNVPEGNTTIYIRGNDTYNNYGAADAVEVEVNSLFTYLEVDISAPETVLIYEVSTIIGFATNYNEETIGAGDVELNLSFNESFCQLDAGQVNPYPLPAIGPGLSEEAYWDFYCYGSGLVEATVTLVYTPDGRTKNATDVIEVIPL